MEFSKDDLAEAKIQIDSISHKLTETIKTLEAKENPERYNADLAMSYYNYGLFINEKKYFVMALKLAKKQPDNPYCRRIIDALEN